MKLSDIFKQQKLASGETEIADQFQVSGLNFDGTKCECDMSQQDVADMSDTLNKIIPDSEPRCLYCKHPAEDHAHSGCGHGSKINEPSRTPLATTYLPHDGELKSARTLAKAINESGRADENDDHRTILSSMGNLESTHPAGETRRLFHKAVFNTINRLMTSGRLPADDASDAPTGLFHERSHNAELLQKMAKHHGGSIMNMYDAYRKYSGTSLEEIGINPANVGESYRNSQQSANQSAGEILQGATSLKRTLTADTCEPCTRHAETLGRIFDAYLQGQERQFSNGGKRVPDGRGGMRPSTHADGATHALTQWHQLEQGHMNGEQLPADAHDYLLRAQSELNDWRDSGHLYGDAHDRPTTAYYSKFPVQLEQPELGSGERRSSWFDGLYKQVVDGARTLKKSGPRRRDTTLDSIWKHLTQSNAEAKDGWFTDPSNLASIDAIADHLKNNGAAHIADRLIKREPVLDPTDQCVPWCPECKAEASGRKSQSPGKAGHEKMLADQGRQKVSIDTGRTIISFITGRRTSEDQPYTFTNVVRETPKETARIQTYGEAEPYYTDLDRYILKRGSGVDLDALTSKRVTGSKTLSCKGKRVQQDDGSYINKAIVPSLVPAASGSLPAIEEHECTEHDGHMFDTDGNITHVRMKNSRDLRPEHKPAMKRLIEQALESIDPDAYATNRERLVLNLGAAMARHHRGETDIHGNYVGGGESRPRFNPGTDLLGTTEQQLRSETPTEQQTQGKKPINRKRKK